MATKNHVALDILNGEDMKKLEADTVKLEKIVQRQAKLLEKQGGIFSNRKDQEALPSSIIRKRRKLEENMGRNSDSIVAAMAKAKDTKSASAIVKASEFTKLQNQVNANEKVLSLFSKGQGFLAGASGLRTASGIYGAGLGLVSKFIPAGIAIAITKMVYDKFVSQFGKAGTRDTRKAVLAEDVSDIGVETETDITSGRKLFLSNPTRNQGLPRGNSNTADLRDGTRVYKLRKEGTYF